ncbi:hypothetical protein P153DRAFT_378427 [Dothidotthia symphoricarpi CBS 119687]|uniref:Uncharacterized protein n=1 Tax=Dothidotthia symphoricarpi CBS 119687 TaxID=1392245 RepID=A0A6A6A3V0_9PLEO|nr:uncharacterized protein P153DRAFT_378427 [Dothidotthia symphoricarpi CBS 119687]KAF2126226.1 hypothetical protein P153DRAFT_378427 [Dothidotthia symphoricarpi CBS 119687]
MLLHADPGLAEVPGFDKEQLDSLARSVELRRQQLEQDIRAYIQRKQDELRSYEHQLLDSYRANDAGAKSEPACAAASSETDGRAKKTKHTRVHKRERELFTFLPLLDALATSPPTPKREKKPKQERPEGAPPTSTAAARDAETSTAHTTTTDMSSPTAGTEHARKARRAPTKKSALRTTNTPRPRRKRVSLAIDDQIVLPADTIVEPPLTSPSETTSTSNSTASLDDCIDPRLTHTEVLPATAPAAAPRDAVHHSLPLTMTHHSGSPTKPLTTLPSAPMSLDSDPPPLLQPRAPYDFTPARVEKLPQDDAPSIPEEHEQELEDVEEDDHDGEESFTTYVGGISGSGHSDVNQAGSYGYPSSLGASYLESYMMSRPLSVRMAAAEKAELGREEKRVMLERKEEEEEFDMERVARAGAEAGIADEDDFMGSMDDF